MEKHEEDPWYLTAFDEDYLSRYAHRNEEEARAAVRLLRSHARLPGDACVFDLCCGAGRHLAALEEAGLCGFGGDLSLPLLRQAAARGHTVLRLDMRKLPIRSGSLHLVTNFFTAFGYFEHDEENFAVFEEIARALRPGGLLLFDFLNSETARDGLNSAPSKESVEDRDGTVWEIERYLSQDGNRAEKIIREIRGGVPGREIRESVRLFSPAELRGALEQRGLVPQQQWGSYDGEPFRPNRSPRYIVLCVNS